MSRCGYNEDGGDDDLALGRWRGQISSALRGKRGQRFLRDLVAALDAMPVKELVSGELETQEGAVCALGCLAKHQEKSVKVSQDWDESDWDKLGEAFNIAPQLAQEVMWINDDDNGRNYYRRVDPDNAKRWRDVREWATRNIRLTSEELPEVIS